MLNGGRKKKQNTNMFKNRTKMYTQKVLAVMSAFSKIYFFFLSPGQKWTALLWTQCTHTVHEGFPFSYQHNTWSFQQLNKERNKIECEKKISKFLISWKYHEIIIIFTPNASFWMHIKHKLFKMIIRPAEVQGDFFPCKPTSQQCQQKQGLKKKKVELE